MIISLISGNGTNGALVNVYGSVVPTVTFLVTEDDGTTPVAGQAITFTRSTGGDTGMLPSSGTTDGAGHASFYFNPAFAPADINTFILTAHAGSATTVFYETKAQVPPVTFTIVNSSVLGPYNGSPAIEVAVTAASGGAQYVAVWTEKLTGSTWSICSSVEAGTGYVLTDSSGHASITPILSGSGQFRIVIGASYMFSPLAYDTSFSGTPTPPSTAPSPTPPTTTPPPGWAEPTQRGNIDFDQVRTSARFGTASQFQMARPGPFTAGNTPVYDEDGSLIDSGIASGSTSGPGVPLSREISTTAPLTGGGDLSTDLTLAIDDFTGDSGSGGASGAVPAPAAGDAAAGKFLSADGTWSTPAGGGSGTVTSVGVSMPAEFSVSGSPVTTSGTIAVTKATQAANKVYAGPTSGSAASPTFRSLDALDMPASVQTGVAGIVIDGGGSAPATGSKGFVQVPYAGTITGWTILANASGSAQVTVKKSTYSGFPTTSSIVASAAPALSSAQKATSTTLTGWTTAIAAGDVLEFNLDSVSGITRLILELQITKV